MSSTEEQTFKEDLLNREDAGRRTFAHEPGEGEAWWWFGVLATIKATAEQTDGRYALVEILAPDGYGSVLHVHHQEDDKGTPWLVSVWPQGCPSRLHCGLGACEAVVRLFARGTGSRHQGNGRAGTVTYSAAPARGAARRS